MSQSAAELKAAFMFRRTQRGPVRTLGTQRTVGNLRMTKGALVIGSTMAHPLGFHGNLKNPNRASPSTSGLPSGPCLL